MPDIKLESSRNIVMNLSPVVQIDTKIKFIGSEYSLPVKILADFTDVPKEYHELYLNSFQYKYSPEVNVYGSIQDQKADPKSIGRQKEDSGLNRIIQLLMKKVLGKNFKQRMRWK